MTDVNEQTPSYSFSFLHAFFFLGVELCYFPFSFFFFSFLYKPFFFFSFFLLELRCFTSLFGAGHFPFSFCGGAEFVLRVFGLLSLFFIFWGLVFSLSLSLDRLNKPLRNRFLLVLSRFSDRLRGIMVTRS